MFLHHSGTFLLFVASILLLVVSVSTPVWHSVYFLKADLAVHLLFTDVKSKTLYLGNWGYCYGGKCSSAQLGYNVNALGSIADVRRTESIVHKLTGALILNPIACGFTFIAFLFGLGTHIVFGLLASVMAALSFFVTFIALCIDLGLFVTVRHKLNDASDDVHAELGNAMWLVLSAMLMQLVATFTVCWTHHSRKKDAAARGVPAVGLGGGSERAKWLRNMKRKWGEIVVTAKE